MGLKLGVWFFSVVAAACFLAAVILLLAPFLYRGGTAVAVDARKVILYSLHKYGRNPVGHSTKEWDVLIRDSGGREVGVITTFECPAAEGAPIKYLPFLPQIYVRQADYSPSVYKWIAGVCLVLALFPARAAWKYRKELQADERKLKQSRFKESQAALVSRLFGGDDRSQSRQKKP